VLSVPVLSVRVGYGYFFERLGVPVLSTQPSATGAAGAVALASSPHLARLTALDLGGNHIGDAGAVNHLGTAGAVALRERFGGCVWLIERHW
jgi:hypothetical protein